MLRRIGVSVLLVVGVTLVTFVLTNLVPGDTVAANLGQQAAADPTIVAAYRAHYGLDKPLPVQYLTYLGNLVHGDLGESQQTHRSVVADLSAAVPATLEIAIGAIAASILIGVGFGVVAAVRRGHLADNALRLVSVVGISVPTFWLAMVAFYVFSYQLDIAPGSGRLSPAVTAPPAVTGLYTVDSLLAGQWATFGDAVAHLAAAHAGADALHGRAAHPVHPLGRAGGPRPGLRALGQGEGLAGQPPCFSATCCGPRSCRS